MSRGFKRDSNVTIGTKRNGWIIAGVSSGKGIGAGV